MECRPHEGGGGDVRAPAQTGGAASAGGVAAVTPRKRRITTDDERKLFEAQFEETRPLLPVTRHLHDGFLYLFHLRYKANSSDFRQDRFQLPGVICNLPIQ